MLPPQQLLIAVYLVVKEFLIGQFLCHQVSVWAKKKNEKKTKKITKKHNKKKIYTNSSVSVQ